MSDSPTPREEVSLDLTRDEVHMLVYGLKDWSGRTDCTESLSKAFGFDGLDDFLAAGDRIANAISRREPLTVRDWTRALLATEVGWVSRVVGAVSGTRFMRGPTRSRCRCCVRFSARFRTTAPPSTARERELPPA